jgi:hypothetical protein
MKLLLAFLSLPCHFVITIRSTAAGMKRGLCLQETAFYAARSLPCRPCEASQSMAVGWDGASGTDIGWQHIYSREPGPLQRRLARNNPPGETGKTD